MPNEGTAGQNRFLDLQYCFFFVGNRPLCQWDTDIYRRNNSFLNSVDPSYFEYLCDVHSKVLNDQENQIGKESQHAALALRTAYSQALETLFALLFASIQAPWCVAAWVNAYKNNELHNLVRNVRDAQPVISRLDVETPSWSDIYDSLFPEIDTGSEDRNLAIKAGFIRSWRCFAHDFLSEKSNREYNSIKHGLRVQTGGFKMMIGIPKEPGVPPAAEDMLELASSSFGSSYFKSEKIGSDESRNLRLVGESRNWDVESLLWGIQLATMSIKNVVLVLKALLSEGATQLTINTPEDLSDFDKWTNFTDLTSPEIVIRSEYIYPFTKEEIREKYKAREYLNVRRITFTDQEA